MTGNHGHKALTVYFVILVVLCALFIVGARTLGRQGNYLAGPVNRVPYLDFMGSGEQVRYMLVLMYLAGHGRLARPCCLGPQTPGPAVVTQESGAHSGPILDGA